MVPELLVGALNHLLAGNDWASMRLKPFSGQGVRLELGSFALPLMIAADGYFRRAEDGLPMSVILSLPADAPLRILTGTADRLSLLADAKITGSVELADCLGSVFRHLEWDVEDELAPIVGDIAARRLAQGGRQLMAWQRAQAWSVAQNLAEYATEESRLVASRRAIEKFCREVAALGGELAELEKRIAALGDSAQAR